MRGLLSGPTASRFVGSSIEQDEAGRKSRLPDNRTPERVAIITVTGSLVNRGAWVGAHSGLTSYEGIGHQLQAAASDPKVSSIVLDIESPGGEAVGAFIIRHEGADLHESDVRDFCIGKISRYKIPKYIFFVKEFPMTGSGKIQKFKLKDIGLQLCKEQGIEII